jgi:lysophospholipase L1-like esterase
MSGKLVAALFCCAVLQAPAAAGQIVEYYGDSTVWGYKSGAGGQVAVPAPRAFSDALGRPQTEVRNEGVSGSTACDLLNGSDGKHPAWERQMAASRASHVVINYGINDQWKLDLGGYKSCLRSLATIARKHGKRMIFETPNPTRDSGPDGLDLYVGAMREVARQEQVPVIDQYRYLSERLNGQSPSTICPDGLHPSDAVYIMKGRFAAQVFDALFPKK